MDLKSLEMDVMWAFQSLSARRASVEGMLGLEVGGEALGRSFILSYTSPGPACRLFSAAWQSGREMQTSTPHACSSAEMHVNVEFMASE